MHIACHLLISTVHVFFGGTFSSHSCYYFSQLLLYEYGGIYADLDTTPRKFRPTIDISPDDEMYTLTDRDGCPAFYFMAAMPRHPLIFLMLQEALQNLLHLEDTGAFINDTVYETTGAFVCCCWEGCSCWSFL